jgi:predicted HTH transcriptional regulator
MDTRNWSYKDLKEFIESVRNIEDDRYEFKESLNLSKPGEIRKDFSAFANSKGGFIFIGIDKNKKIKGIPKDDDLPTRINRCLSNSALNPNIDFEPQSTILIPHSAPPAYVYIYYIKPSLSHKKPHVSDCKVFIREQGESKPVSSGDQMRELFILSRFHPEYIDQLEYDLGKIRHYEYSYTEVDFFYLKYLGKYLDDLIKEQKEQGESLEDVNKLMELYKNICDLITKAESLKAKERSATEAPSLTVPDSVRNKYDELADKVDKFISLFKKVHSHE